MTQLLNAILDFSLLEQDYSIGLDWLGQFAKVIIEGVGIIGVGIIVFTILLKAITLPFDIYQRVKMRKQNLVMRQMQPELEKLQKQYANDKTMYAQKMQELYKKNGYGMLGACLPMIISLVILIVAFQGFRAYSQYANLNMYAKMSVQYNEAILDYAAQGKDYRLHFDDVEDDELTIAWEHDGWSKTENGIIYTMVTYPVTGENGEHRDERYLSVVAEDETKFLSYIYSLETKTQVKEYKLDTERLYKNAAAKEYIDTAVKTAKEEAANAETPRALTESEILAVKNAASLKYTIKIGASRVREWYADNDSSFLWVKNVWYPDVSYSHPIQSYSEFKSSFNNAKVVTVTGEEKALTSVLNETNYENLVSELTDYTTMPNGYFVLIILSIGLMVLSQFISMRSQKEMNKYQSVDGSGASTQKMMLIIMPIIYAVFAFMYSAAFSIYMTISSLVSLLVTVICNFALGKAFNKKEEQALIEKYSRTLPWQKKEENTKKNNKNKKNNNVSNRNRKK